VGERSGTKREDAVIPLLRSILSTSYAQIPRHVITETKYRIIDTIAALLAGSKTVEAHLLLDYVKDYGGREQATVMNYGVRVPVEQAGLLNATMARGMDLDDVYEGTSLHVHVVTVPTAFAVAEAVGEVSGKELLKAVILGSDLMIRLSMANRIPTAISGMNATYQLGCFAATVTAGLLLRLNEAEMLNAMGIAYALLCGNSQCLVEGAMTTRLSCGVSVRNGIFAAQLAKRGFSGVNDVLEGLFGYYPVYQRGEYDREQLLADVGTFRNINTTLKLYPCCMHTHAAIEALKKVVARASIKSKEVDKVKVYVNRQAFNLTCLGKEQKCKPSSIAQAQFSMPYVLGSILYRGDIFLQDFTEEAIHDPNRLHLAKLIECKVDAEMEALSAKEITPAKVEVHLRGGTCIKEAVHRRRGHPELPLSPEEIREKLKRCARFAWKQLPKANLDNLFDIIMELEEHNPTEVIKLVNF